MKNLNFCLVLAFVIVLASSQMSFNLGGATYGV